MKVKCKTCGVTSDRECRYGCDKRFTDMRCAKHFKEKVIEEIDLP